MVFFADMLVVSFVFMFTYLLRYNLVYSAHALSASLAAAAAVETDLLDATTVAVTAKLNNPDVQNALDTLVWSFAGDCKDGVLE